MKNKIPKIVRRPTTVQPTPIPAFPPVERLGDAGLGVEIIVVGAGPSIDVEVETDVGELVAVLLELVEELVEFGLI